MNFKFVFNKKREEILENEIFSVHISSKSIENIAKIKNE